MPKPTTTLVVQYQKDLINHPNTENGLIKAREKLPCGTNTQRY